MRLAAPVILLQTDIVRLTESTPLKRKVELGAEDTLKILLTAEDGKTAKRPHQAFLNILDPQTGLETSFPFTVRESGKAKLDLVRPVRPCAVPGFR